MEKIYKGYELMGAVTKGLLSISQKISTVNRDYMNCTIENILNNKVSDIMDLDFVLIEDELSITDIEKLYINDKQIGTGKFTSWVGRNLDITFANKINELIQEVNQLKK